MRVARLALGLLFFAFIVGARPTPGAAQAPPAPAQRWDGLIERLSTPGQWQAEWFSNPRMSRHALSGDGRYFVFVADVANPPYEPIASLLVRDRMTGETTYLGGPLNGAPVISSDGNHRAFETCDMYRPDALRVCDVWAIDARTGRMENMSTAPDGTPSLGDSSEPMLSGDGRFIVFRTNSSTLLPPGAAPGQLVLRDRDTDGDGIFDEPEASSIRVVSVSSGGETGNLESAAAEVSDDGRFVAFRSRAGNLVAGDTNDASDVFVHDVESGETRRVNVGSVGEQTTSTIDAPAISMSADGALVAFATDAAVVADPTHGSDDNHALDVMIYDRVAGTLARVDLGAGATLGNGHTHSPSLSADGRYVAVVSNATNVENPGTPGRYHAFVYDRATAQATRVSVKPDGSEPDRDATFATISGDGSLVTFVSRATNLPTAAPPDTDTIYAAAHFDVAPLTLTLPARGGEVRAAVTAQRYVSWGFQVTDWNWLNWGSTGAWGMGDGTATFQAARNQSPTPRTTTAVANSRTITITQEAGVHIAGFSPAQGPASGGTVVTITGGGFEPGMRVFFDGTEASSVEFVDKTSLRVVTPAHASGDAWFYVATADWSAAAGSLVRFRYTDVTPPLISRWLVGTQSQDGWFTSDVQIMFGFYDPESAIVGSSDGCNFSTLTTDTPGTTFTCSATSEGGTSTESVTVKRDATGPAVEIAAPAPTIYNSGDPAPLASYTCTDALNSVADCTGLVPLQRPVDMTPGYHDFWVSSRDRLGNFGGRLMTYAVVSGSVCAPRPDGLVAWFPFEGTYADAVSGVEATAVNTQFVPGRAGDSAMAPAASPSYVRTEAFDTFRMTSAFTLAAWVKPGAASGGDEVIAGREGEYLLGLAPDGTLQWSLSTSGHAWGWNRTFTQLQRNVWAHVALVYDGTQVTVYVNGISREGWSVSGPIVDLAEQFNQFRIGGREDDASPSPFSGAIDDVLLANRAFSSSELQQIALAVEKSLCAPRATTVTVSPDPVTVPYGGRVENVYTLTLTSDGVPVAGRTLYFFDPTGLLLAPSQTDANGQIRFGATAWGTTTGTQRGFEARFLGDFYYTAASGTNVLVVEPALPVVTWAAPAAMAYGTPLGPGQLNASADVPGTFTYTPAAGTPLTAGTHTLSVQFNPTSADYRSTTATTTVEVTSATPTIAVTAPSAVYDGLPHGATGTLTGVGGEALGPLTFTYNGAAEAPVNAGSYAVVASYTGDGNYTAASATATITISKAAPVLQWAAPAAIAYGTALSDAQLNATANVGGSLAYTPAAGTVLDAGTHALSATFTPADPANYTEASASTTLDVTRATPTITVTAPSAVYDGQPHGATGTVTGVRWAVLGPLTFTYNGAADAPVNAGTYAVVASYAGDANYTEASATATITIGKAAPVLQWAAPAAIAYGTPLSNTQLNATADVGGTMAYTPAAGTVLAAGTQTLSATFTPADPANYSEASVSTTLDVARATPTIAVTAASAVYDGHPHGATGTVTGVGGAALGPLAFTYNGAADAPVNAGSYAVAASYAGDANYTAASATATITISKAAPVLQWAAPAAMTYGTALSNAQLNATASVGGVLAYTPAPGAVLAAGTQTLTATFTPADPANYTSASASTTFTVNRAPLTIRAVDAVKRFGAPLPALTVAMTGFVNGESAASLGGALALVTPATPQSAVGTYPIVPSGVSSANYAIAFVNGTLAVVRGAIDVTVVTSPEPSGFNGPMTFTASVSAAAPAAGNPSGLVRFFDGATLIGTAPLTGGTATLSTAGLDAGVRTIQAQYDGDGSFEPGTDSESHVIRDASQTPSVAVSSSRNPSSSGQWVTLTATVTMPAGAVNGLVEFYDGAALLGSSAISSGRATFPTTSLAVGSHAITARYTGGNGVPPARSEVFVQAVGASGWRNRTTSMTVTATPNPAVLGDSVTVTADVSGSSGAPTGRILFMVDGAVVADVAVTARSSSAARATLAVPGLAHGRHTISATYLGDPTYKGSTNRLTAVVN